SNGMVMHRGRVLCIGLLQFSLPWKNLRASSIVMVEAGQDREGEDLPACGIWWQWFQWRLWNLLLYALMRPGSVEVVDIGIEHALELLLMEDEQMIEALTSHTAQEALTDGIRARGVIRRFENLDSAGGGHTRKTGSKFAITIANEILWSLSISGCLSQLLRSPGIGRRARDLHMDDSARVQEGGEEGKQ